MFLLWKCLLYFDTPFFVFLEGPQLRVYVWGNVLSERFVVRGLLETQSVLRLFFLVLCLVGVGVGWVKGCGAWSLFWGGSCLF